MADLNPEQVRALLTKIERLRSPGKWDVDWNSLTVVLVSDGSGEFAAKAAKPHIAEGIVAAVRLAAEIGPSWLAQGEALAAAQQENESLKRAGWLVLRDHDIGGGETQLRYGPARELRKAVGDWVPSALARTGNLGTPG